MMPHKVNARIDRTYSKQFNKLFHNVSYGGTHSANSQPFGDWDSEENQTDREGEIRERLTLVRMQPFACDKKRFL